MVHPCIRFARPHRRSFRPRKTRHSRRSARLAGRALSAKPRRRRDRGMDFRSCCVAFSQGQPRILFVSRRLGNRKLGRVVLGLGCSGSDDREQSAILSQDGIPISYAFAPQGVRLIASLATGITAGFCEEALFRGFLMTDFHRAGYGKVAQVILPGIAFGFSHLGYTVHGFVAGAGIMIPTAILGMLWGVAYLLGRRCLVPCMVAHFLNDATALSWIGFFMFKGTLG
jgi:hypothetical protein